EVAEIPLAPDVPEPMAVVTEAGRVALFDLAVPPNGIPVEPDIGLAPIASPVAPTDASPAQAPLEPVHFVPVPPVPEPATPAAPPSKLRPTRKVRPIRTVAFDTLAVSPDGTHAA